MKLLLLLLLLEIRSKKQRERESNMLYEVGKDKKSSKVCGTVNSVDIIIIYPRAISNFFLCFPKEQPTPI